MDAAHLDGVELFAGLSEDDRQAIARLADEVTVAAGKELVHEDGQAWAFFVIRAGEAEVRQGDEVIAKLGPGNFFGEIGVMDTAGSRRTASVVTTSELTAIVMASHDLRTIARGMPPLAERLQASISRRIAEHP